MLYKQAVPERALELLEAIQANAIFEETRLVGDTSLGLQIGHRISMDLDFFGNIPLAHEVLAQQLSAYGAVTNMQNTRTIKIFKVDDVKIDLVHFTYGLVGSSNTGRRASAGWYKRDYGHENIRHYRACQ